jgi:predicted PurR-regulated permease PerM
MTADRASQAPRWPSLPAGWARRLRHPAEAVAGSPSDLEEEPETDRREATPAEPCDPPAKTGVSGGFAAPVLDLPAIEEETHVPVRTILATIGIVLATVASLELLLALHRVILLLVIAAFLAVVLSPAVSALVRLGMRRGMAVGIVFLVGLSAFAGVGYLFVHPLYDQAIKLSTNLPDVLAKTQAGQGSLGKLIARFHLQKTAAQQIPKIRQSLGHLGGPAMTVGRQVVTGLGGLLAIMVLTFLLLLDGPDLVRTVVSSLPPAHGQRVRRILRDVAKSVTGYVVGNAATSVIAGLACMVTLLILGVPFAVVFGVWVALVDLLPLVGGLLAGVPTVAFAFLHSPTAGIVTLIVFLVYQQLENHVLNPMIMSRTVKLNPLWVILSVLAGAEIASIIGALLAIPAAGAIQVVARDLWDERQGQLKRPPTVGPEEKPIS